MELRDFQKMIRELRKDAKREDRKDPIGIWREKDRLNGRIVNAFVLILRTRGCRWAYHSGCSMCGYFNDTNPRIGEEELRNQIKIAREKYGGEELVKVFTSGSFLDDWEVPSEIQSMLYEEFADAERIVVESRPEYVTTEKVKELIRYGNIMVALGLESANDTTLKYRINKGFEVKDYIRAAQLLRDAGVEVKTYILLKPPFMSERMAIEEATKSIEFAAEYSNIVSLNPMNIQNHTLVEYLWRRGEYRAPWLWSVVEVLQRTAHLDVDVVSYPTAGGTKRGAHNCGKCDARVLEAIRNYSLTQNIEHLNMLDCECRERWRKIVENEDYTWDYTINL